MANLTEPEIQALIALAELEHPITTPNSIEYKFHPSTIQDAALYFRSFKEDWSCAYPELLKSDLIEVSNGQYTLTLVGKQVADQLRRSRPPIYYWYREFYTRAPFSRAHARFCEKVYGRDLCQDGFADMAQLHTIIRVGQMGPNSRVLDLGCGNGMISEYLSDITGARVRGIDYIPEAIDQAMARTRAKRDRLCFEVQNMDEIASMSGTFDMIVSIDTLYMPNNLTQVLAHLKEMLESGGCLLAFYTHMAPEGTLAGRVLLPAATPLGQALTANNVTFCVWDFTDADYRQSLIRAQVAEQLRGEFESEGNESLYRTRRDMGRGNAERYEAGGLARYLYCARVQDKDSPRDV